MTQAKQFQVRLVERDVVSPLVDFNKLTDWIQQGRISANDCVRAAGETDWRVIQDVPEFATYLPHAAAVSADDEAEAYEAVDLGFGSSSHAEEEEDPDMIPLIDISLVLLVFFMLTAAEMITASPVETPPATNARVIAEREPLNINVAFEASQPQFFLDGGDERKFASAELADFLNHTAEKHPKGSVETTIIRAQAQVPYETIQALLAGLTSKGFDRIEAGVSDHQGKE
ncbi:MAG TPA: biopolymer transporter ExbD [Pirellulales bacterium]